MKITIEYLEKLNAYAELIEWFRAHPELEGADYVTVCAALEGDRRRHWSVWLREAIASNASTPPTVLARLAKDEVGEVRAAVAWNRNTSSALLAMLAGDGYLDVRLAVVRNHNTPRAVVGRMAKDIALDVRLAVRAEVLAKEAAEAAAAEKAAEEA